MHHHLFYAISAHEICILNIPTLKKREFMKVLDRKNNCQSSHHNYYTLTVIMHLIF